LLCFFADYQHLPSLRDFMTRGLAESPDSRPGLLSVVAIATKTGIKKA